MGRTLAIGGLLLIAGMFLGGGWMVKDKINSKSETLNSKQVELTPTVEPTLDLAAQKLTLSVSSPADGAVVKAVNVTVKGKTAPKAEVSINDVDTKADLGGNFSAVIKLDEGENYVVIVATDDNGDFAKLEMMVNSETFE